MEEYLYILGLTCLGWIGAKLINLTADQSFKGGQAEGVGCVYCGRHKPALHYLSILYSCPYCGAPYPRRIWFVDLISVSITLFLGMIIDDAAGFFLTWMVALYFITIMIIDLEKNLIFHKINFGGTILCGAAGFYLSEWKNTLLGGIAGLSLMFVFFTCGILYIQFISVRRDTGKYPSAIGFGDVLLCGNIGLFIGFPKIIPAIFLGIFLAGIIGLSIKMIQWILLKSQRTIQWIPISPFFILSAVIIEILPKNVFLL